MELRENEDKKPNITNDRWVYGSVPGRNKEIDGDSLDILGSWVQATGAVISGLTAQMDLN